MRSNKKILLILGVFLAALLLAFAAWHYYRSREVTSAPVAIVPLNDGSATSSNNSASNENTVVLGSNTSIPQPSLERSIPATSPDLSPAARTKTVSDLAKTIENLKKTPYSYQDWIYLGLERQMLSDYLGAEEAWVYATKLAPSEEVAFANLGNLYMLYLQDGPKSENNYKTAIRLNPKNTNNYRSLLELYTYHYKQGTSAGELILKEGIQKNPGAYDLGVLLARLYKDAGRTAEARSVYATAAQMATAAGKADISASITAERDQLK